MKFNCIGYVRNEEIHDAIGLIDQFGAKFNYNTMVTMQAISTANEILSHDCDIFAASCQQLRLELIHTCYNVKNKYRLCKDLSDCQGLKSNGEECDIVIMK